MKDDAEYVIAKRICAVEVVIDGKRKIDEWAWRRGEIRTWIQRPGMTAWTEQWPELTDRLVVDDADLVVENERCVERRRVNGANGRRQQDDGDPQARATVNRRRFLPVGLALG